MDDARRSVMKAVSARGMRTGLLVRRVRGPKSVVPAYGQYQLCPQYREHKGGEGRTEDVLQWLTGSSSCASLLDGRGRDG